MSKSFVRMQMLCIYPFDLQSKVGGVWRRLIVERQPRPAFEDIKKWQSGGCLNFYIGT